MLRAFLATLVLFLLVSLPAFAQQGTQVLPSMSDARVTSTPQRARAVLDLSGRAGFSTFSLADPDRIVIDVSVAGLGFDAPQPLAGSGIVSGYTVEMAGEGRARVTIMLNEPAQVQQAYVLDRLNTQPARLVVDLIGDTPQHFAKVAEVGAKMMAATTPPALDAPSTPPGASNIPATSRPLVVIDPGHGGADSGALSDSGTEEKDVVLAFALKLQEVLARANRVDVALTRYDDEYLSLNQRVDLARKNKANLFISIHADTFHDASIRGASVYTRDEKATDILDKVLADNENKSDLIAGLAPPNESPEVVSILVDLMRRQTRKDSFLAAQSIITNLDPSVRLRRIPQRQADFFVLQAPDVPSVLVELGFLSNRDDVHNLVSDQWRDRVAEALARGIVSYFDGLAQK